MEMVLKGCLIMGIYITIGLANRCYHNDNRQYGFSREYVKCTWEEKCVVDSDGWASCEPDNSVDSWIIELVLCAVGAVLVGIAVWAWYYCKKRGFSPLLGNQRVVMAQPAAYNQHSGAVTTTAPDTQNIPTATQYPVSPVPYPPTAQYPPPAGGYPPAQYPPSTQYPPSAGGYPSAQYPPPAGGHPPAQYPPPAQFQPVAQYPPPPPPGDKKAGDENSSAEKYGPLFD